MLPMAGHGRCGVISTADAALPPIFLLQMIRVTVVCGSSDMVRPAALRHACASAGPGPGPAGPLTQARRHRDSLSLRLSLSLSLSLSLTGSLVKCRPMALEPGAHRQLEVAGWQPSGRGCATVSTAAASGWCWPSGAQACPQAVWA